MNVHGFTPEQEQKIRIAISRAEGPGACSYQHGCVIAQLALLEGASPDDLVEWDKWDNPAVNRIRPACLASYGADFVDLSDCQFLFDSGVFETVEEARRRLIDWLEGR